MSTARYTQPVKAEDVTEELVHLVWDVVDGWYQEGRIDWGDVWDRVDGSELADGTRLDLGNDLNTPALAALKRAIQKRRRGR